jgi:hypothetical protein
MAVSRIDAVASAFNGVNSATVTIPATAQEGDLAVLTMSHTRVQTWTTPTGWTLLTSTVNSFSYLNVFTRSLTAADAGATLTVSTTETSNAGSGAGVLSFVDYRGVASVGQVTTNKGLDTWTDTESFTLTVPGGAAVASALTVGSSGFNVSTSTLTGPSGWTEVQDVGTSGGSGTDYQRTGFAELLTPTIGTNTYDWPVSLSSNASYDWSLFGLILEGNSAPNAPIPTAPADGATIDLGITQRFQVEASDPDPGDSTSKTYWRYRAIGAASWTEVTKSSPNTYYDFPADTFAAGDYEWQAATEDAQGLKGPYCSSAFFTAAVPTGVPTITDPTSGGTVDSDPYTVAWSTAGGQDAYQLRRVADNAGAANELTVYHDTGEVVSTTARSRSVPFETNNRYEHIQVRVKLAGLWSAWASIRVLVSYTPPMAPTFAVDLDSTSGSMLIDITNPEPTGGEPSVSYNDVSVDDGAGFERRATFLATNSLWRYWTPISGRDYSGSITVTAVATNGTSTSTTSPSAVTDGGTPAATFDETIDGGTP